MTEVEPPPVPTFNLSAIVTLRNRLADDVLLPAYGCTLEGVDFARLVTRVHAALPKGIATQAVSDSLRPLLGQVLSRAQGAALAWQLAGNVPRLKQRLPVLPWLRQEGLEWVPLRVEAARYGYDQQQCPGHYYRFQIIAGSACPLRTTLFWSRNLIRFLAPRLGFTAPWGKRPLQDGTELVQLRMLGLLEPRFSRGQPGFHVVHCPSSLTGYNRRILKMRWRDGFTCPEGYTHACHRCPVGYRSCPAACHPHSLTEGPCGGCGEADAYFDPDPDFRHSLCVSCQPLRDAGLKTPLERADASARGPQV